MAEVERLDADLAAANERCERMRAALLRARPYVLARRNVLTKENPDLVGVAISDLNAINAALGEPT